MDSVFVVFSGEYLTVEINTKQLEGNLPVFRIEAVFSSKKKCEEWIEHHSSGKATMLLNYLEIPFDSEYGQKEEGLQLFKIRMNSNLQILEIHVVENEPFSKSQSFTYEVLGNGDILGSFWARDFIDACKLAYIRLQETNGIK
ncbi:hypothetical protein [Algoriphagus sp. Y33]|uniref:hypothetical protein n=1 Tax=Algoriphagus sp. Y33 TaxID=2772483 RepID=UPI001786C747|nr:hypothetical protein [Algoriphagus sp. Y33]